MNMSETERKLEATFEDWIKNIVVETKAYIEEDYDYINELYFYNNICPFTLVCDDKMNLSIDFDYDYFIIDSINKDNLAELCEYLIEILIDEYRKEKRSLNEKISLIQDLIREFMG